MTAGAAAAGILLAVSAMAYLGPSCDALILLAVLLAAAAGVSSLAVALRARRSRAAVASERFELSAERRMIAVQEESCARFLEDVAVQCRSAADAISGFSEMIAEAGRRDLSEQEITGYAAFIQSSSRNLSAFATELRDFVRLERGLLHLQEQDAEAAELAEAAIRLCRDAAEARDVTIIAELTDGIELRCDLSRIRNAMASLVRRAVENSPAGGTVEVHVRSTPDHGLDVEVIEAGGPLPPQAAGLLFEPDFDRNGLSALTLPVARRVALLHSGDVTVSRADGGRNGIRLRLPAARVTVRRAKAEPRAAIA